MAAFFSLGTPGSSGSQNPQHHPRSSSDHHHHHHHHQIYHYPLTWPHPSPDQDPDPEPGTRGFQLWQQYVEVHHHHRHPEPHASFLLHGGSTGGGGGGRLLNFKESSGAGGGGGMNCQDCGNKAKKDCAHLRCRTCCKSRGFDCPTHVKSTWVPAAKRRERHQQQVALRHQQLQEGAEEEEQARREKRMREIRPDQTLIPPTTTGLEVGHNSLPSEVSSSAMFRCVKVMSATEDDPEEHIAYQTAINIGGHLFKGILYDQGPDQNNSNTSYARIAGATESSSGGSSGGGGGRGDAQQNHHLFLTATTTTSPIGNGGCTAMMDPNSTTSVVYPTPINAFMAGTQFLFPHSRS
ncbi:hypothetical protein Cgig2_026530 [Carnegiea gigantea]|uniref:Uncharacterized protein n=1 Tax=Carnegiea gigantea TaxID=171969 RepID=A0A9Q1QHC8_9CARY|nr:hypothetical protein Cgig2_026530 [Carnegiea gigantea]